MPGLRQVGIEVNIVNFPLRVFFGEILPRRRFTMALFFRLWHPTNDCLTGFSSEAIPTEANGWRGGNVAGYRDGEMDQTCKGSAAELDPEARKRLLQTSARIFSRDLPVLPLYYRGNVWALKEGLQNFAPRTIGSEIWNAHTWYWK